ncbi:phBC6A51 family helix-turn-helix protein [Paenibacillus alvei]|uniref:Homeodomain phBC6A51-type domain-containing protein n=1 Tax=Paenibacillus alvei TaxID=44250 RepID=A0AAP7A246_PAEAL|nr:phBC6A51 family helix-turn-helix protein [Paenibacillus alvei]NOJ71428.1 hypothetical protein [Paenibacillus alvei]
MRKRRKSRRLPLNDKQLCAIDLLANTHLNHEDIARELGVCRMTLYRWRQRPDFERTLQREINRIMNARFRDMQKRYMPRTVGEIEHVFRLTGLM